MPHVRGTFMAKLRYLPGFIGITGIRHGGYLAATRRGYGGLFDQLFSAVRFQEISSCNGGYVWS
jgi:hypothetical protein